MTDPYRPLKNAFGRFATGVTIVSCKPEGADPVAITVNSFTSVSLDPSLVLWCLETRASTFEAFMSADNYAVSVLRASGEGLSNRFADHAPTPLSADEREVWITGAPILKDRLAAFDCRVVDRHRSGDHVILVGKVLKFDAHNGAPLLYFASNYAEGPEAE
ncbi:MAG: flavin reductase family protein [Pseudomonadota bacterium]